MNTAQMTERFILEHRAIRDCLQRGLINYSALSRVIAIELGIDRASGIDAILIALRRTKEKLQDERIREEEIIDILKRGELEIKNKVVVAILEKSVYKDNLRELAKKVESQADLFHAIEGSKTITIVTLEKYLGVMKEIFKSKIIRVNKDLVEIVVKSPPEIEKTPGVASYLFYLFAEHDVNIYELLSCWTDTILVISEKDLSRTMTFLKF